jgi:hypothetical protein
MKLLAGIVIALGVGIGAANAAPVTNMDRIADSLSPIQKAQYFIDGRRYCWYWDGWHGPGWYWCGYAWRRGFGWGGGHGWHGWRVAPRGGVVVRGGPRVVRGPVVRGPVVRGPTVRRPVGGSGRHHH